MNSLGGMYLVRTILDDMATASHMSNTYSKASWRLQASFDVG